MQASDGKISSTATNDETYRESQPFPKIDRVFPAGKEVAPDAKISVHFNEEMDESTVSAIEVTKNGWEGGPTTGEAVAGKWSTPDGKEFTFTPTQLFAVGSLIVIRPSGSVQSKTGAALELDKPIFSFLVDDEHRHGNKEIRIPSIKKTNNGTHNLPMRITLPEGEGPFPVMFWVHGGGWKGGTPAESIAEVGFQAAYLADHLGIAVVGVAYRNKGSNGTFTEGLEDVKDAIQFVQDHAADYHLDARQIGLYAGSAGTPLASLTAQRTPEANLYIGTSGIYDFVHVREGNFGKGNSSYKQLEPSAEANSAIYNIRNNPPTTLLLYGTNDTTINGEQSIQFAKAIQAAGGQAQVLRYEGEEHGFIGYGKTMEIPVLFAIKEFIREIWGSKGEQANSKADIGKGRLL